MTRMAETGDVWRCCPCLTVPLGHVDPLFFPLHMWESGCVSGRQEFSGLDYWHIPNYNYIYFTEGNILDQLQAEMRQLTATVGMSEIAF
jgi:tRNA(Leu) C34 or U34 (ribose-2'-O)-methylase TrmL